MGCYVELRAKPTGNHIEFDELKARLLSNGCVVHPEYGIPEFIFESGTLTLNLQDKIDAGHWGWVRLSWTAEEWEWKRLIDFADKIGAMLYDASIDAWIIKATLEQTLAQFRQASGRVVELLGTVESNPSPDDVEGNLTSQFFFACQRCGISRVSEHTAREFLSPELWTKLDERLHKGAVGAKLTFETGCPICKPGVPHEVEVTVLKPRISS